MYELQKLNIKAVDTPTKERLYSIIPWRYHHYFKKGYNPLVFTKNGEWMAVALFAVTKPKNLGSVSYFHVEPAFQTEENINYMLHSLEATARRRQTVGAVLIYDANPTVEATLPLAGWSQPQRFRVFCEMNIYTFKPDWMDYPYQLSEDYQIFPWKELTEQDRTRIRQMEELGVFPGSVSPLKDDELLDPTLSKGLRYKGDVVGWIIVNRIADDTVQYAAFYTIPEHRGLSHHLHMLTAAIRDQMAQKIEWGCCEANLSQVDNAWYKFVETRLVPHAEKVAYSFRTLKPFTGKWTVAPTASL